MKFLGVCVEIRSPVQLTHLVVSSLDEGLPSACHSNAIPNALCSLPQPLKNQMATKIKPSAVAHRMPVFCSQIALSYIAFPPSLFAWVSTEITSCLTQLMGSQCGPCSPDPSPCPLVWWGASADDSRILPTLWGRGPPQEQWQAGKALQECFLPVSLCPLCVCVIWA